MNRWLTVVILVLLVLTAGVGLRNIMAHPTVASTGAPVPPSPWLTASTGAPVPPSPWASTGAPVPPSPWR
jgi:hypothetical protein